MAQLLADPETREWEQALTRLARAAPGISRDWLPAPDAMALLIERTMRVWE
ncbi:hypothetical protein [Streptomyces sp. NPDC051000]|uniref:hypothetical protein n=1 Tax=Streptomyces sp. NPDC051000 TaxID=3155520 RepID=UPI0033ECE0A5